jgi:hypothetical protein
MQHPKEGSAQSVAEFQRIVSAAKPVSEALFELPSGRHVRVKRAERLANQVHALHGETIAVHIPNPPPHGRWCVLSPLWQLKYALSGKAQEQHALHPLECMVLTHADLDGLEVENPESNLEERCRAASDEIDDEGLKSAVRACRDALENLHDTLGRGREALKDEILKEAPQLS